MSSDRARFCNSFFVGNLSRTMSSCASCSAGKSAHLNNVAETIGTSALFAKHVASAEQISSVVAMRSTYRRGLTSIVVVCHEVLAGAAPFALAILAFMTYVARIVPSP